MKHSIDINWVDETDSTNSEVLRHPEDFDNLSVLSARMQTAGRGQRGNKWETRPGENLTFSLVLRPGEDGIPPVEASGQFLISMISTLAVKDTLAGYGIDASVKWPNDIYVGNNKLCGMLIENILAGNLVSLSVIGIGLNVNQTEFSPSLLNPASMASVSGGRFDTRKVLEDFAASFMFCLEEASRLDGRTAVRTRYIGGLYRKDTAFNYTDCRKGEVFRGTIRGITEDGRLLVEKPAGLEAYSFKEISYII